MLSVCKNLGLKPNGEKITDVFVLFSTFSLKERTSLGLFVCLLLSEFWSSPLFFVESVAKLFYTVPHH